MRPFLSLVLCVAAAGIPVAAAEVAPLSVDDAVQSALRHNPRLSAAAHDIAAARSGLHSAGALANPDIVFSPDLIPGGSEQEFLVQQPLEINGVRSARTGVARALLRQTQAEAIVELRTLVAQTKSAYFELARAQALERQGGELLQTAEELDRLTRRQVEAGTRPGIDQTQTGIEVVRARQQLTQAQSRTRISLAALNTLMGHAPTDPAGTLPELAPEARPSDREALRPQALANRAEVEMEAAKAEGFRQEARLARAQGRPDVVPQFRAASITRGIKDAGVGIGISLPFVDYGSRRNRIRQAEEAARAQGDRAESVRAQVTQEVDQALSRLTSAETVVRDYRQGVLDQARRLLEGSERGFQSGLTTVVQLLEARRTYRAVQTEYTEALVELALAQVELERATGAVSPTLLPPVPSTSKPTKPNPNTPPAPGESR